MKPNSVYKQLPYLLLIFVLSTLLVACGGGGGSDSAPATASQGVFIDSAVEGVRFETTTQSGLTDVNGTFSYMAGEVVNFYVGGILLGSATGSVMLTPIDFVANATDEMNGQVTNILRFLQSLDSDSNLSNGIQISAATRTALAGQSLDFSLAAAAFETAFDSLSGTVLGSLALVSVADAQAHMRIYLDSLAGGSTGNGGTGNLAVTGADTPTIGSSFDPDTVTPLFTATTVNISWMGGNTNAGNLSRIWGLSISTLNGQISLLQFDLQDARNYPPLLSYSYSISCWPVVAADCSKITFDTGAKRLVLNNVQLMNRTSVIIENQATGSISLNGTLTWE